MKTPVSKFAFKWVNLHRYIAESLRLYPEPPILIRRCLEDVPLPRWVAVHVEFSWPVAIESAWFQPLNL